MKKKIENTTTSRTFKREDFVRQPNSISRMKFRMELVQLRAFALYLEQLEPVFLEMIDLYHQKKDGKKISITQTEGVKKFINSDGLVEVKIQLKDLKLAHSYYNRARPILENMANIIVRVPLYGKSGEKEWQVGSAFHVTTAADNGMQRCSYFKIGMLKSTLDHLIDIRMGYHDLLKRIVFLSSNIYTTRLYVLVSSRRFQNSQIEITLDEFRDFMNLLITEKGKTTVRYPRFCDLYRRVIKPSVQELKELAESGNSDFYVDIERKDIGENQNPSAFIIKVHESNISTISVKKKREEKDKELLSLLTELKQSQRNIKALCERVTADNRKDFISEVKRTIEIIANNRKTIAKPSSYAWTILNGWLDSHTAEIQDVEEVVEVERPIAIQQELFPEDIPEDSRWNKFLVEMKGSINKPDFEMWISAIKFVSEKDKVVTVSVPSKFVYEYLEEHFLKEIQASLEKSFGTEINLVYRLQK